MDAFADMMVRLETATNGSRELDVRIHVLIRPDDVTLLDPGSVGPIKREPKYGTLRDIPLDQWEDYTGLAVYAGALHYTTSLDAALTLRPEGANCWGMDHTPLGVDFYWSRNNVPDGHWLIEGHHKTSDPLAACIAAFKARSMSNKL